MIIYELLRYILLVRASVANRLVTYGGYNRVPMLVYDLRLLLYLLLLSHIILVIIAIGCTRWWERRQRFAKLRHLLQANLEHAPLGVFFFDGKERYVYANAQARWLLQLPEAQGLLPDVPWIALLDEDVNQLRHADQPAGRYRTLALSTHSSSADKPPSTLVQWWITQPLIEPGNQSQPLYMIFVLDQSQAQRLEQQTNLLLGRLAHELRTPLSSIQTHAEILTLATFPDPIYARSVAFIRDETQRLFQLASKTLELARLEGGHRFDLQALDLLPVVDEVVTQLASTAQAAGATLTLEAEAGLPPVMADRPAIKQLLLNLLENSIKHGGPNNRIVIQLALQPTGVHCAIRDQGVGIEARHLPWLTQPFYRAAQTAVSGSGLGLALVAEILRRHHSELQIESRHRSAVTPGGTAGTTVRFVLPAVGKAQDRREA